MNGDKYFADTNVFLYALDVRHPLKQGAASGWVNYLWTTGSGRLSWQVINEFYFNAVRKIGVPAPDARLVATDLGQWKPGEMSHALMERAWYWMDLAQLSYWDALILASADEQGCRWLLSEDFQAGRRYGNIEVINPFQTAPPDLNGSMLH